MKVNKNIRLSCKKLRTQCFKNNESIRDQSKEVDPKFKQRLRNNDIYRKEVMLSKRRSHVIKDTSV
jgi:hypothetical protein